MSNEGWAGVPAPRMGPPVKTRFYGGVPDRLGGLILDGIIYGFAQIPVIIGYFVLTWIVGLLVGTSEACRYDAGNLGSAQSQYEACMDSGTWWFLAVTLLYIIVLAWVWWRLIPGRMVRYGASVGMGIAGLEIEEAETTSSIGAWRSLWRVVVATLLPLLLSLIPLVFVFAMIGFDPESTEVLAFGVVGLLVLAAVLYVLPWLWAFWDGRNQTLYDKAAGTVVVGPPGPTEPWAVAALVCGILAVFGLLPLGPLAVIFGSVGIKHMRGTRGQIKGRGAARAGQVLGAFASLYLLVAIIVLTFAVVGIRRENACDDDAERLERAAEEFRVQQGRYPNSDAELVFAGQLDEPSERYEVSEYFGELRLAREDDSCPSRR